MPPPHHSRKPRRYSALAVPSQGRCRRYSALAVPPSRKKEHSLMLGAARAPHLLQKPQGSLGGTAPSLYHPQGRKNIAWCLVRRGRRTSYRNLKGEIGGTAPSLYHPQGRKNIAWCLVRRGRRTSYRNLKEDVGGTAPPLYHSSEKRHSLVLGAARAPHLLEKEN